MLQIFFYVSVNFAEMKLPSIVSFGLLCFSVTSPRAPISHAGSSTPKEGSMGDSMKKRH